MGRSLRRGRVALGGRDGLDWEGRTVCALDFLAPGLDDTEGLGKEEKEEEGRAKEREGSEVTGEEIRAEEEGRAKREDEEEDVDTSTARGLRWLAGSKMPLIFKSISMSGMSQPEEGGGEVDPT